MGPELGSSISPEDLSAYLLGKGLDPDAVQDVLVEYLTWTGEPIRYPKTWAWRHVYYRTMDRYRKEGMRGRRLPFPPPDQDNDGKGHGVVRVPPELWSKEPDPLTQVEQRQRLERFAQTMKTSCKPSHQWSLWNQRGV